jgi:hypothetical protein
MGPSNSSRLGRGEGGGSSFEVGGCAAGNALAALGVVGGGLVGKLGGPSLEDAASRDMLCDKH